MDATFELVIRTANVAALFSGAWVIMRVAIPTGLAIRDSLRDTASELAAMKKVTEDHEERLRNLEHTPWHGEDRRRSERRN